MTKVDKLCGDLEEIGMYSPARRIKFAKAVIKHDPRVMRIDGVSFHANDEVIIRYRSGSGRLESMPYTEVANTVTQ